jgi:hypothetical protein
MYFHYYSILSQYLTTINLLLPVDDCALTITRFCFSAVLKWFCKLRSRTLKGKRILAGEGTSFPQKLLISKCKHFYVHFVLEIINQTTFSSGTLKAAFIVNFITSICISQGRLNQVFSCFLFFNSSFHFQYTFYEFNQYL